MTIFNKISQIFKKREAIPISPLSVITYKNFISIYKRQVFELTYIRQLNLAIIICEKLMPDYYIFYECHKWGNPDVLLDSISLCKNARSIPVSKSEVEKILQQVDSICPHMDDFGDEISSYALNVCTAVFETLTFIIDNDPIHIYNVGISYTDIIDFKIQEGNDLDENEIDKTPLMIEARQYLIKSSFL